MIKKENTRICITIPKTYYNELKRMKKRGHITYSILIKHILDWYFENNLLQLAPKFRIRTTEKLKLDKIEWKLYNEK